MHQPLTPTTFTLGRYLTLEQLEESSTDDKTATTPVPLSGPLETEASVSKNRAWGYQASSSFPLRCLLALLFVAALAVSIVGGLRMKSQLLLSQLCVDGSQYQDYLEVSQRYFSSAGAKVEIVLTGSASLADAETERSVAELEEALLMEKLVTCTTMDSLRESYAVNFDRYGNNSSVSTRFRPWLRKGCEQGTGSLGYGISSVDMQVFLGNSNFSYYQSDIPREGTLRIRSRYPAQGPRGATQKAYDDFRSLDQELQDGTVLQSVDEVFSYSRENSFLGQVNEVPLLLAILVLSTSIAVGLVTLFFLGSLRSTMVIMTCTLSVQAWLWGFAYLINLDLNMVVLINAVLSVSFAVDNIAHVIVTISHVAKTIDAPTPIAEIVDIALGMAFPAVVWSAGSSMCGSVLLCFAPAYILRVFGYIVTATLVISTIHALVFVPWMAPFLVEPIRSARQKVADGTPDAATNRSETSDFPTISGTTKEVRPPIPPIPPIPSLYPILPISPILPYLHPLYSLYPL